MGQAEQYRDRHFAVGIGNTAGSGIPVGVRIAGEGGSGSIPYHQRQGLAGSRYRQLQPGAAVELPIVSRTRHDG